MSPGIFLWPKSQELNFSDWIGTHKAEGVVELQLRSWFPDAEPVVFSSARAGLTATLQALGLSRPDVMWTPAFSSHCVLEAISHVCSPTSIWPQDAARVRAALVYHQWGHLFEPQLPDTLHIIEDAVDTMFMPGAKLFTTGGSYVLWSLPKVIGSAGGGVVFCRTYHHAEQLKAIRDRRSLSWLQSALRLHAKSSDTASLYWNGAEAMQGSLHPVLLKQTARLLKELPRQIEHRLDLIQHLSPSLRLRIEASGRIPSNLPLAVPEHHQQVWGAPKAFTSGLRTFARNRAYPHSEWVRVAPLPIHQDVTSAMLDALPQHLTLKGGLNELEVI